MGATTSVEGVLLKQTLAENSITSPPQSRAMADTSFLLPSWPNPKQRTAPSWKKSDDLDTSSLLPTDGTHSTRNNASFTLNTRFRFSYASR
jgi:hypothetical protein